MAVDLLKIAAATGSDGGLGKIGTLPATTGNIYARIPCGPETERVEWMLKSDNAGTYQLFRSLTVPTIVTLTLDALDDTNVITINGLDFTAETTLEDALAAERKFFITNTDNTADAVSLAALINDEDYGVPGVVATSALAVVTLVPAYGPAGAPVIQAVVGTGTTTGECAIVQTGLTSLYADGIAVVFAANASSSGLIIPHFVYGWPQAYIQIINTDGDAATVTLSAARYRYRD